MERHKYEELELLVPSVQDRAVLKASSWVVEQEEGSAAYQVDRRLRSIQGLNQAAVDAIVELDDYIDLRSANRHPAVVASLRQLQQVTGEGAARLIAHYMMRSL